jgi:hypothetical protein
MIPSTAPSTSNYARDTIPNQLCADKSTAFNCLCKACKIMLYLCWTLRATSLHGTLGQNALRATRHRKS